MFEDRRAAMFHRGLLPVAGVLALVLNWPSSAVAQCVTVGLDQTCTNAGSIAGPLNATGGNGAPGVAGGHATVNNTGSINPGGATATGGAGGDNGGGNGGDGGSAALSNWGSIAGNVGIRIR